MESFAFELKLLSNVDRVASGGTAALRRLEGQGKKTEQALNFSKTFERVEAQMKRLDKDPVGFVRMKKVQKEIAERQKKLIEGAGLGKSESFLSGLTSKFSVAKLAGATAIGEVLGEGIIKAGETLLETAHKFVEVIGEGVSRGFEEAGKQQTLRLGERLSLGGKGGTDFREDTNRFSKLTGFNDDAIRALLLPLRRGGMGQQGARTAFAAATDVAAGEGQGGNFGRVSEVLADFQNIFLKGGINEKKLINLGVNGPEFYKQLAADLKISGKAGNKKTGEGATTGAEEAKKRAAEGKIDPQLLLNTIFRGIEKRQGGKLGTGGIEYSKTFDAHLEKVKNLPNEYLKNLVDSPAFARANEVLGRLLENLDPESPTGQRIMGSVEKMFERITGFIGDPEDAADSLADKIEDAIHFAEELADDFRSWADALLPSLQTVEDMVIAAREMKAIMSNDTKGFVAVELDKAKIDQRRNDRFFDKKLKGEDSEMFQANVDDRLKRAAIAQQQGGVYGPINMPAVEKAARADTEAQKNDMRRAAGVTVHVHPGAVVVHAAPGDDPDKSHREAGQNLHKHVVREMQRAAQQGGG